MIALAREAAREIRNIGGDFWKNSVNGYRVSNTVCFKADAGEEF
jgi:hypothetical protein